jgi:hypothetical protein
MLYMVTNSNLGQCLRLRVTTDLDFMPDKLFPKLPRYRKEDTIVLVGLCRVVTLDG